ncbi:hypothetical protein FQZ97_1269340 [compost metagenome]
MKGAARQVPNRIGVHVAEKRQALFGILAQAGYMFKEPNDLQAAEVGRNGQACFFPEIG